MLKALYTFFRQVMVIAMRMAAVRGLIMLVLVAAPSAAFEGTPELAVVGLSETDFREGTAPITVVGEVGSTLPPITLFQFGASRQVRLVLPSGSAAFLRDNSVHAAHEELVTEFRLPPLVLSRELNDEKIHVWIDGTAQRRRIRIGVVEKGAVSKIAESAELMSATLLLDLEHRLAVVDIDRLALLNDASAASKGERGETSDLRDVLEWCPPEVWIDPPEPPADFPWTACAAGNLTYGLIEWIVPDPRAAGFSV